MILRINRDYFPKQHELKKLKLFHYTPGRPLGGEEV
jgi:hypothetical protein